MTASRRLVAKPLDHLYRDEAELMDHALTLDGTRARAVANAVGDADYNKSATATGKTGVGAITEAFFGRKPNSSPEPDIRELGVEVKSIPITRTKKGRDWRVKEPTSLTMIDYDVVLQEDWADAHVHKKLRHILWIPYEHDFDDKRDHLFLRPFLWRPDPQDLPILESDYQIVRSWIERGRAHELSETLSLALAARRKGASGTVRTQPKSPILAPSRAWALKTGYTGIVVERYVMDGRVISLIDIAERLRRRKGLTSHEKLLIRLRDVRTLDDVMTYAQQQLASFEGWDMGKIATAIDVRPGGGKNRNATIVRGALGLPPRGMVEEFEKLGIRVHQLNIRPADGVLHQAVPFPAMVLKAFADEEWEESELVAHVDRILFVPTWSAEGKVGSPRKLGRAFFWSPSPAEWKGIEQEWRTFQGLVNEGKAIYVQKGKRKVSQMPSASDTRYIHMRPHGRTGIDVDIDPLGQTVTKQCFWLNKEFVQSIVERHS